MFSGRIHISHYLVGVTFYILDATAIAVPFLRAEEIDKGKGKHNFVGIESETKENKKKAGLKIFIPRSWLKKISQCLEILMKCSSSCLMYHIKYEQ